MAMGPNNEQPIGGEHSRGLNQVAKTGIKADLVEGKKILEWVKDLTKHMKVLRTEADMTQQSMNNMGPGGSSKGPNGHAQFKRTESQAPTSKMVTDAESTKGSPTRGAPADMLGQNASGMKMLAAFQLAQFAGQGIRSLDNRIDRGRDYALSSDRIGSQWEQMYGQNSMQYMTQVRKPLANYRLGPGGINQLAQMQMRTGFNTTSQQYAGSIEGIRALSGFSKTTSDVLAQQNNMLNPEVANRMFALSGISPLKAGGGIEDPLKVQQQLVRTMGMSGGVRKGALAPGSIDRARLRDLGLSEEMITDTLTYATQNEQFQKRGGKGMYDPTKKDHREKMGVEGRLSTEVEETEAKRVAREEDFQRRQMDNFETMERNTQRMVEIMGSIEDKLSGIVGARASSRSWMKTGGKLLQIAGAGAMFVPGGQAIGAGMMVGGMAMSGDPGAGEPGAPGSSGQANTQNISSANDGNISVPWGYSGNGPGKPIPLESVKTNSTFKKLSGTMQSRLLNLFRAGQGKIGLGGGYRDPKQQEAMFRDRYVPAADGDVSWNGQKWKRVKGAPAAPPGRSMHEIGMAADLVGDMNWLQQNAGKFGLKTFADVNNEPWHVQPAELPNSRREYEGGNYEVDESAGLAAGTPMPAGTESDPSGHGGSSPSGYSGALGHGNTFGASLADLVGGESRGRGWTGWSGGGRNSGNSQEMAAGTPGPTVALSGESGVMVAAQAAYNAGFRGEDLFKIVSIAGRESGWKNTMRSDTSDTGIWQINWSANEKHARAVGATKREDLLDPNLNARAAYELYKASGFHGWKASGNSQYLIDRGLGKAGWDPNGDEMWHTDDHQAKARDAINALNLSGDGAFDKGASRAPTRSGANGNMMISQPVNITISPHITMQGGGGHMDLQKVASEVGRLLRAEVETLSLRGA